MVADAVDLRNQSHALGNVVSEPPEVDDIAAGAQMGRALDQRRLKAGGPEPERKRRPGDSCSRDQYGFGFHVRKLPSAATRSAADGMCRSHLSLPNISRTSPPP